MAEGNSEHHEIPAVTLQQLSEVQSLVHLLLQYFLLAVVLCYSLDWAICELWGANLRTISKISNEFTSDLDWETRPFRSRRSAVRLNTRTVCHIPHY